ncbi:MAG: hypothetical protein Q9207_008056 [Kuettlingeria erythrocarpa]
MTTVTTEVTDTTIIFRSKTFTCHIYNWRHTGIPSPPSTSQSSHDDFREYKQLQRYTRCLDALLLLFIQPSRVRPPHWSGNYAARAHWRKNMKETYMKLVFISGELDDIYLFSLVEAVKLLRRP